MLFWNLWIGFHLDHASKIWPNMIPYDLVHVVTWCKWVEHRFKFCDNSNTATKYIIVTIFNTRLNSYMAIKFCIIQNYPGQKWPTGWWIMRRVIKRITDKKESLQKWPISVKITIFVTFREDGKIWSTLIRLSKNHNAIFFQKI